MLLLATLAAAATLTEVPPWLRGDLTLAYTYDRLSGPLEERPLAGDPVEVGQRAVEDHRLDYRAMFAFAPGVALAVELPHHLQSRVAYGSVQTLVYDPATGTGTAIGTTAGETGVRLSGSGLGGVWIGIAATPFSEAFTSRANRASWRVDAAFRTGDRTSLWTTDEDGKRGAGTGTPALRLATAFSTRTRGAEPYLAGAITAQLAREIEVAGPDGTAVVTVDPGNFGEVRAGAEILAARTARTDGAGEARLDLHLRAAYQSWRDIPSGVMLAEVLDASLGTTVQEAERLEFGGGLGFLIRPSENLQFALRGDVTAPLPWRIESPYPIYAGPGTVHAQVGAELTLRIR